MFNKMISTLIACLTLVASPAFAQVIGMDDFDGGEIFISRTLTPDNSANGGIFPSSMFDVFGIVDRNANDDFADDTLIDPMDTDGAFPSTLTDSFFAYEDLQNDDNLEGTGTVVYVFDISGATDLVFSADFAAYGDFETANDSFEITASIDGSAPEVILTLEVDEEAVQTYPREDGTTTEMDDPFSINGTFLSNAFQNFSSAITGTGNELTLTLSVSNNGGNEIVAMNNLAISGGGGGGGGGDDCPSGFAIGDVNQDGAIDLLDVGPFVNALTNGDDLCEADVNGDGSVNLLDVGPFVELLSGG